MIRSLILMLLSFCVAVPAMAFDDKKCSTMLNKGTFKKYQFQGVGSGVWGPISAASKSQGSTKASSAISTESSTASVDPGLTTNKWGSTSQMTSSFGPCATFALKELKENRNLYLVQNKDRVFDEIAVGGGEHLRVLATLSLCEEKYFDLMAEKLQMHMESFLSNSSGNYNPILDSIVQSDSTLANGCFSFDKI